MKGIYFLSEIFLGQAANAIVGISYYVAQLCGLTDDEIMRDKEK